MNKSASREFGDIGEEAVVMFLMKQGFDILDRNYSKYCGEIDIVAKRKGKIHFIEVKTAKVVSYETIKPEENLSPEKIMRVRRTVYEYISEKKVVGEWQIDGAIVHIDYQSGKADIEMIWDMVFS